MKTIGQRIREGRIAAGLTQEELAAGIVSRNQIGLIEKDLNSPSLKTLTAIADKLNLSMSYFLSDSFYAQSEFLMIKNRIDGAFRNKDWPLAQQEIALLTAIEPHPSKLQQAVLDYFEGLLAYHQKGYSLSLEKLEAALSGLTIVYADYSQSAMAYAALCHFRLGHMTEFLEQARTYEQLTESSAVHYTAEYVQVKVKLLEYLILSHDYDQAYCQTKAYVDKAKQAGIYFQIGHFLMLLTAAGIRSGRLDEAESYGWKAYQFYKATDSLINQYQSLGNLGLIRLKKGQFETARKIFQTVYSRLTAGGSQPVHLMKTLVNITSCRVLEGDIGLAELKGLVSKFEAQQFQEEDMQIDIQTLRAYSLYLEGNYQQAQALLLSHEQRIDAVKTEMADFYYSLLSEVSQHCQDYEHAYRALKRVGNPRFNIFNS